MTGISWQFVRGAPRALPQGHSGLALDVGAKSDLPGIIHFTHHGGAGDSSTSMIFQGIEALNSPSFRQGPVSIFCHVNPDLDCFASSYLAWAFLKGKAPGGGSLWGHEGFKRYAAAVSGLLSRLDQGWITPLDPEQPTSCMNFYSLFLYLDVYLKENNVAMQILGRDSRGPTPFSRMKDEFETLLPGCGIDWTSRAHLWMASALSLLHGLFLLDPENVSGFLTAEGMGPLPSLDPLIGKRLGAGEPAADWLPDMLAEMKQGIEQDWAPEGIAVLPGGTRIPVRLPTRNGGPAEKQAGVYRASDRVAGLAAKLARVRDVAVAVMIILPQDTNRVVISVSPGREENLKGLGRALHLATIEKRQRSSRPASGSSAVAKPRWLRKGPNGELVSDPLFDHPDPWYDGRGHEFTIVDAPRDLAWRNLSPDEIVSVLKGDWHLRAADYDAAPWRTWAKLPDLDE